MHQAVSSVFMVRPAVFYSNPETAASNAFQQKGATPELEIVLAEFDELVFALRNEGVQVYVYQDTAPPNKPDAIFPNNWLGLHDNGIRVYYAMEAPNRRIEKHDAVCAYLDQIVPAKEIVDISDASENGVFLEGTGSLIFDYLTKRVFASRSSRTNENLARKIAELLGFEPVLFDALDSRGNPYYHTNVILSIGTRYAILCSESIPNEEREKVKSKLAYDGRTLIEISREQVNAFAGNVLELRNSLDELLIVISSRALEVLTESQLLALQQAGFITPISIPTIETFGGGSVRCMLAEIRNPWHDFN
ncbi:MAG: arginine deiminase-related protein [Bacteroidia bacterium]